MNKLLQAELSRRLTSAVFIAEIISLCIYNLIEIVYSSYGFSVDATYFLFGKTPIICILIAANTSLQLSQELDNRTINNKLFCGFSKSDFYKTELFIGITEGMILLLVDTISVILFGNIQKYDMDIFHVGFFINFMIVLIIVSTVAVISTVFSLLINHRIISVFLVIGMTLLFIYGGKETVRSLNQPAQTTLFSADGELHENPLYVEGSKRVAHNVHLLASPYAQSNYADYMLLEEKSEKHENSLIMKNVPYHIEFVISDVIESLLLYLVGFYVLNKRNLQ